MRADDSLLFGFGEDVHDSAVSIGPVAFCDAMDKKDIDVFGFQLATVTIEVSLGLLWIA